MAFIDLSKTGPVMIELPAGPTAGGLSDFWQREFGILGEMGPDQGRGGRHLIVPPGQQATAPEGVLRLPVDRHERVLRVPHPRSRPEARAVPVPARCGSPPSTGGPPRRPGSSRPWAVRGAPLPPRGIDYWARLHARSTSMQIVDERDRFYLAMLRQLGIEKGRPFTTGDRLTSILTQASATGELMAQANSFDKRFDGSRGYWPDRQWDLVLPMSNSAQRGDGYDELLEAHLVVLRGGDVLGGDAEPDAGQGPGVPVRLHRRRRQLAGRRRQATPCGSRPTRRPGCSGRPRSTTRPPAA